MTGQPVLSPSTETVHSPPVVADGEAAPTGRNRSRTYGKPRNLSAAELAEQRSKPLKLSEYQRHTLAKTFYAYGDDMLRELEDRAERGVLNEETEEWMAEQVDGWYELADAMVTKRKVT